MPRYLLDTSALLAHFRKESGWQGAHTVFEAPDTEIYLASPSLTEFARRLLALGFSPAITDEVIATYRLLVNDVVAIDESIAMSAIVLGRATPSRLPLADALIAAAAKSRGAILLHRDGHFSAIPGDLVEQQMLD